MNKLIKEFVTMDCPCCYVNDGFGCFYLEKDDYHTCIECCKDTIKALNDLLNCCLKVSMEED